MQIFSAKFLQIEFKNISERSLTMIRLYLTLTKMLGWFNT